jgi:hypothetical protein
MAGVDDHGADRIRQDRVGKEPDSISLTNPLEMPGIHDFSNNAGIGCA